MPDNSVAIVFGASGANETFLQTPHFWHLTGMSEPDAALLLVKGNSIADRQEILVVQPRERDAVNTAFYGTLPGLAELQQMFGIKEAATLETLETLIQGLLKGVHQVLIVAPQGKSGSLESLSEGEQKLLRVIQAERCNLNWSSLLDLSPELREDRLVKSYWELAMMQRAAEITANAHLSVMRTRGRVALSFDNGNRKLSESHLWGELEMVFRGNGSYRNSFFPSVAAGKNACCLHYKGNQGLIGPNDLVLIDAAGSFGPFASDVTRTWPISGKFSEVQAAAYGAVLRVQELALAAVRPGTNIDEVDLLAKRALTEELVKLGIVKSTAGDLIGEKAFHIFMCHSIGHLIGLETHDVFGRDTTPEARRAIKFEPGMVVTIEPGLYFDPTRLAKFQLPPEFEWIGVRIEDTVVVTKVGHLNLTLGAPKRIKDIEAVMSRGFKIGS